MKKVVLFLLCVLFLILDNTVVPFLAIKGYYPSLLFTFVLCYAIVNDKWSALWIGVFSGLLQDLYLFNGFGVNSLTNMLVCVLASLFGDNLFREKSLIPIMSTLMFSLIKNALVFSVLYIAKQYTDPKVIVFNSVYGLLISFFMYKRVYNLCQRPFMKREWKFNED
jgi:rod shape-determining protein MreD